MMRAASDSAPAARASVATGPDDNSPPSTGLNRRREIRRRRLPGLLSRGLTQREAARRLGVSRNTIAADMAALSLNARDKRAAQQVGSRARRTASRRK